MKLSVHLFTEDASSFRDLLDVDEDPEACIQHESARDLPFRCEVVLVSRRRERPAWADYLAEHFALTWAATANSSAAVLAEVDGRFFAVTFGHSRHLLASDLLVPDFGLRVTANSIRPESVRSLGAHRLDAAGMQTSQWTTMPTRLSAFRVQWESEWVHTLGGGTDDELTRSMSGSQALRVEAADGAAHLSQLDDLLRLLLKQYQDTSYRAAFPSLDLLRPLPTGDSRIPLLDDKLLGKLQHPPYGHDLGVSHPDAPEGPTPDDEIRYRVTRDGRHRPPLRHEIDLNWAHSLLRGRGIAGLRDHRVTPVRGDGERIARSRPAYDFLTAEAELEGEPFVLAGGRWFHVDADTLAVVERKLASIGTAPIAMPLWRREENETPYNARAAAKLGCINMEEHRTALGGANGKIEVCDLLDEDFRFICVKKLRGSSALSHLFSQGSVSARLFAGRFPLHRSAETYEEYVRRLHAERWPRRAARDAKPTIVYAVGSDRRADARDLLPFFSRVNLTNHADTIAAFGFETELAKITIGAAPHPRAADSTGGGAMRGRQQAEQGDLFDIDGPGG